MRHIVAFEHVEQLTRQSTHFKLDLKVKEGQNYTQLPTYKKYEALHTRQLVSASHFSHELEHPIHLP